MTAKVADIMKIMNGLAQGRLAENWDNVGLQVGSPQSNASKVLVALDPLLEVVEYAIEGGFHMLITHHPLIFGPLKSVDFSKGVGRIIQMAAKEDLAIFASHTNLDKAPGGVNDILAGKIGIKDLKFLESSPSQNEVKLVVFVPKDYEKKMLSAIWNTPAGRIGNYSCCTFRASGVGTFKPGDGAKPHIGKVGEVAQVDEIRLEVILPKDELPNVLSVVRKNHPYETPAMNIYPLISEEPSPGFGRIGNLDESLSLADFVAMIKERLSINHVKYAGDPNLPVKTVALCSGSGGSLMKRFLATEAQVYVSGDLGYHNARDAEAAGRAIVDLGHFASESVLVGVLAKKLNKITSEVGLDVKVEACLLEKDPFIQV